MRMLRTFLLEIAEREGQNTVTVDYVIKAKSIMEQDLIRNLVSTLTLQYKAVLASIILNRGPKENVQQTTGEVYNTYNLICQRFQVNILTQRRVGNIISELDMQGLINAKVVSLGRQGRTKYITLEMDQRQIEAIFDEDDFVNEIIEGMKESRYFSSMQLRLI